MESPTSRTKPAVFPVPPLKMERQCVTQALSQASSYELACCLSFEAIVLNAITKRTTQIGQEWLRMWKPPLIKQTYSSAHVRLSPGALAQFIPANAQNRVPFRRLGPALTAQHRGTEDAEGHRERIK